MSKPSLPHIDESNFESNFAATLTAAAANGKAVLLDFSAVWCAPCRAVQPHLEALATQYQGRLCIGKVDVDDSPVLAARFDVRSLPTLLVFRGGEVVGQLVGAVPRARIADLIERALLREPAALST